MVRFSALLLGMFGVILILSPRQTVFDQMMVDPSTVDAATLDLNLASRMQTIGALAALMAAIFSALAQVFARKLVATETTGSIVFYFSVMSTVLALLTLPFGWTVPGAREVFFLITAGLLGGVGQILLTESYRHAEVSVIAPVSYTHLTLPTICSV